MRDFAGLNNERQIHLGRENRDIEREKSSSERIPEEEERNAARDRGRAKEEEGTRYKNGERGKKEKKGVERERKHG